MHALMALPVLLSSQGNAGSQIEKQFRVVLNQCLALCIVCISFKVLCNTARPVCSAQQVSTDEIRLSNSTPSNINEFHNQLMRKKQLHLAA